ncbi:hypothetical protein BKA56DRAFT_34723 [Ilyonectria sp. MPI-CAGE-AT-0026]|nr:hypothetical protein BKA56DRAFT_34723 [Ilyonectria sp. MPI-CAGE-AT-0026]
MASMGIRTELFRRGPAVINTRPAKCCTSGVYGARSAGLTTRALRPATTWMEKRSTMTTLSGRSRAFRVCTVSNALGLQSEVHIHVFSIALQHAPPSTTTIDDAWREQPKCPDPSPDQVQGRPVDLGKFSAKGGNKRMSGRASWWTLRRMKLPLSRFAYPDSSPRLSPAMLCPISLDYRPRAEGHPDSWRRALTCTHAEGDHEEEFCEIGSRKKKSTEQQRHGRGRGGGAALMRHGSGADVRSARWAELSLPSPGVSHSLQPYQQATVRAMPTPSGAAKTRGLGRQARFGVSGDQTRPWLLRT